MRIPEVIQRETFKFPIVKSLEKRLSQYSSLDTHESTDLTPDSDFLNENESLWTYCFMF